MRECKDNTFYFGNNTNSLTFGKDIHMGNGNRNRGYAAYY